MGARVLSSRFKRAILLLAAGAVTLAPGCSSQRDRPAFLHRTEAEVASTTYLVRPPDAIRIHAPSAPEIDGVSQVVRADGRISLRLLGEVEVAGLTPDDVAEKLRTLLSRYYIEPEVVVEVSGQNSAFYYVLGEVQSPGPRRVTGRDNLLRAVAEARPTDLAWLSKVRLIRPGMSKGERRIITVDYDDLVHDGDARADYLLQEGDIIEIPPTPLAWVGQRFRDLVYPIGPAVNTYAAPTGFLGAQSIYEGGWNRTTYYGGDPGERDPWWRR